MQLWRFSVSVKGSYCVHMTQRNSNQTKKKRKYLVSFKLKQYKNIQHTHWTRLNLYCWHQRKINPNATLADSIEEEDLHPLHHRPHCPLLRAWMWAVWWKGQRLGAYRVCISRRSLSSLSSFCFLVCHSSLPLTLLFSCSWCIFRETDAADTSGDSCCV